eukprot:6224580-Alexandrium_andersonii.AAC.1
MDRDLFSVDPAEQHDDADGPCCGRNVGPRPAVGMWVRRWDGVSPTVSTHVGSLFEQHHVLRSIRWRS